METDKFKAIIPNVNWKKAEAFIPHIANILPTYGIDTSLRKAHFLAQLAHESGGLRYTEENLNYSAKALRITFRKYFANIEEAEGYARQPEKIANRVYANRMGNGDESSGDGWKFRGRGLIQLTGKENYQKFGKSQNMDFISHPELILEPEWALKSAAWYWKKRKINQFADLDDIHMVTKRVNGGTNGLSHRQHYLAEFKRLYQMLDMDGQ